MSDSCAAISTQETLSENEAGTFCFQELPLINRYNKQLWDIINNDHVAYKYSHLTW